jgi:hypothetical protein
MFLSNQWAAIQEPVASNGVRGAIETAKNVAEIAAILGGALWTYINYFRGRVYKHRLESILTCEIQSDGVRKYLAADVQIKNVGLSKIPLCQSGTALVLSRSIPLSQIRVPAEVIWTNTEDSSAFPVLTTNVLIEPGESISDQVMIQLPTMLPFAYKLELRIGGTTPWTTRKMFPVSRAWTGESQHSGGRADAKCQHHNHIADEPGSEK